MQHEKKNSGAVEEGTILHGFRLFFSNVKHLLERKSGRKEISYAVFHLTRSFHA